MNPRLQEGKGNRRGARRSLSFREIQERMLGIEDQRNPAVCVGGGRDTRAPDQTTARSPSRPDFWEFAGRRRFGPDLFLLM